MKKKNLSTYSDFLTYRCSYISVITYWRSFIQMVIIQMAHIVNNHIIMAFYRLHSHWYLWTVSNYMLIISHTDVNHIDTGNSPQNTQTYMKTVEEKKKKKKVYLSKNPIAKLRPHQMTGASQRASRAVARERQNLNKQSSAYLWLFFGDLILFGTLPATKSCCFFTTKTLFLSIICSITDTNNNSLKRWDVNKWITIQITTLLFLWTKSARWNVVPWTLISQTKPGFTAVDSFVSHYQDESGMYCSFFIHVLKCTAYTNLANTFLISLPSKNSDLSSMLEA